MAELRLADKARKYLETLCSVKAKRCTGSPGNRRATEFFASVIEPLGYEVDTTPFACMDYSRGQIRLSCGEQQFEAYINPYSLPCDLAAELIVVSTDTELEKCPCADRILLLSGEICNEQLMPKKNFIFYNPEHHRRIYALLEEKHPAAIITAIARNPGAVGALYPFPLIADGDFDIPTAHCTDLVGEAIAAHRDERFRLRMQARRIPSTASNVIARTNPQGKN